jgi:signal transduction histidine kinase
MQSTFSEVTYLTVIISTTLLLLFGSLIVYYFFQQQRRRYQHIQEVTELRESFNQILLQSKLEIQEQTLDHIAKELHANFSHLVSLININLAAILAESHGKVKENIQETKSLAKQLMADLKVLSVSLNSDYLIKTGFSKALSSELDRLSKTGRYKVTLSKTGQEYRIKSDREIILYRLCQETLNNIVKHSGAKIIHVSLDYSSSSFKVQITDDGKGFDVDLIEENNSEQGSTGLINMKNRARLINGELVISSEPGKGTSVSVLVPSSIEIN